MRNSRKTFQGLNYTLANEDTALELAVLPFNCQHVLSVAGSGSRVLPLLSRKPRRLTCVDLSQEQMYLAELRFETVRNFSRNEFLQFWGYSSDHSASAAPENRKALFARIGTLRPQAREFFREIFERESWREPLYFGKREQLLRRLSPAFRFAVGKRGLDVFKCRSLEEQREFMKHRFPTRRWNLFLSCYGRLFDFLRWLNPASFPRDIREIGFGEIYHGSFSRMFMNTLARENFMLQLIFFGRVICEDALPVECQVEVFEQAKEALSQTVLSYQVGEIVQVIRELNEPVDFVSFSNTTSYFDEKLSQSYLQMILDRLLPSAQAVVRYFGKAPEPPVLSGYKEISEEFCSLLTGEKTQAYDIRIFLRQA
jgi:S-adenosylmethionine-diacylglycerol 3-amino-3-carboxypropyl transferase